MVLNEFGSMLENEKNIHTLTHNQLQNADSVDLIKVEPFDIN